MEFEVVHDVPIEKWDKYVLDHPMGNIFHTHEMFDVLKNTRNYETLLIFVLDKYTGDILAFLPSVEVKLRGGLLSRLTSRSILFGSFLVGETELSAKALDEGLKIHDEKMRDRVLFTEVRNRADLSSHRFLLEKKGYIYNDDLTYIIDLRKGIDNIFQSFSTDKRKNIRKAERKGIIVKEIDQVKQVSIFYDTIKNVYAKRRIPLADKSLFENSFSILFRKGFFNIFLAQLEDKCIAGKAVLLFKNRVLAWYGGAGDEWSSLHANEMLTWHVIKWAIKKGFDEFDFGGAGKPEVAYGVRDYKARFGGKLVNNGRYIRIYSPALFKLANGGYQILRRLPMKWGDAKGDGRSLATTPSEPLFT